MSPVAAPRFSRVDGRIAVHERGAWSWVAAKFAPGFSTVGPPIAGSLKLPIPGFLAAAGPGWVRANFLDAALQAVAADHGGGIERCLRIRPGLHDAQAGRYFITLPSFERWRC